jgi:hypothetical protein
LAADRSQSTGTFCLLHRRSLLPGRRPASSDPEFCNSFRLLCASLEILPANTSTCAAKFDLGLDHAPEPKLYVSALLE